MNTIFQVLQRGTKAEDVGEDQVLQRGTKVEDVGEDPLRVLLSYIIIRQFPQANFFRPIEQERNLYMSQSIALYLF